MCAFLFNKYGKTICDSMDDLFSLSNFVFVALTKSQKWIYNTFQIQRLYALVEKHE